MLVRRIASIVSFMALFAAPASGYTRFSIVETSTSSGAPLDALAIGDSVTIGLRADVSGAFGLDANITGYDDAVADFVTGRAITSIYGIVNEVGGTLVESDLPGFGSGVRIFSGRTEFPGSQPTCEPGLDGSCNDAQFRIKFLATGLGSTRIFLGSGSEADAVGFRHSTFSASVTLVVVPEPTTALLSLMGLTGLAWRLQSTA